jgi:hypothetical protein
MGKLKVVLAYKAYPFTIANYYRRALERRNDVELFTLGEFFGQQIPWNGGMEIPMKYYNQVDLPLPIGMNRPTWKNIEPHFPWKPDLILNVDAGFHFSDKPKVPYIVVGTDPHVLQDWYDDVRPKADIFYSMQTSYMRNGDKFLNYAFDQWCHYPTRPLHTIERFSVNGQEECSAHCVKNEYDCSLIGLHYPHRNEWVSKLRAKGITVNYRIGDIYDEYREENNKAWIGLNWSSLQDVTARVFEICAMRLVPVLNRLDGLDKLGFEEGRHYLGFSTMEEAVEKVLWAKNNRPFAEQISLNAYNFVHEKDYTYDKNVRTILRDIGLA